MEICMLELTADERARMYTAINNAAPLLQRPLRIAAMAMVEVVDQKHALSLAYGTISTLRRELALPRSLWWHLRTWWSRR